MSWAIWITGPPGSGESVIARAIEAELRAMGQPVKRLQLDEIQQSLTPRPRHSDAERDVVYRALGYLAGLLVESGMPVLIDAPAPRRIWRELVREAVPRFAEIQLVRPLEVCRERAAVDVPYEPALAPELLIDTSVGSVTGSVERIMRLVRDRLFTAVDGHAEPVGSGESGWAIWITGRPGSGKSTLASHVAESLRRRGARVHLLSLAPVQERILGDRPAGEHEQDIVHRVLAYAAQLLTENGEAVIVDATAGRRAWRDAARTSIPSFAEIQLLCPSETCLERERAVRWGLTFESPPARSASTPDIVLDYEESAQADLTIRTDLYDVQTATRRVLALIQRLAGLPTPT